MKEQHQSTVKTLREGISLAEKVGGSQPDCIFTDEESFACLIEEIHSSFDIKSTGAYAKGVTFLGIPVVLIELAWLCNSTKPLCLQRKPDGVFTAYFCL